MPRHSAWLQRWRVSGVGTAGGHTGPHCAALGISREDAKAWAAAKRATAQTIDVGEKWFEAAARSNATFACRCGVRFDGFVSLIFVTSPRTGRQVSIPQGWWHELPERLARRIVAAAAVGRHVLAFTRDELLALAAVDGRVTYGRGLLRSTRTIDTAWTYSEKCEYRRLRGWRH